MKGIAARTSLNFMHPQSHSAAALPGLKAGLILLSSLTLGLVLSACGGGGGGSSGTDSGGTGESAAGVTTFAVTPTLSGVAAVGAPLSNAQIKVIDAAGAAVGSATTQPSDGSYSLSLSSKSLKGPLLIQTSGLDSSGSPQVLHSIVPILDAAKPAMVAHVTPLSQAIVALSLGSEPQAVFASAAASAALIAPAASAASAAGEFVKTLIKTQLTDLKITNTATLNLLYDPGFVANKSAQDLLLEVLRVQVARNNKGVDQLLISNKLQPTAVPEVVVGLAAAQIELVKATGGLPANAISSSLKLASTSKATLDNLASLDELSAGLNNLIAQGKLAADFSASALLGTYESHNAGSKADLAARLAAYAANKRQLGRLMVLGCADDVLTAGLCKRVMVAATVSDSSGAVLEYFSDAATFTKAAAPATTGGKWSLIGNARKLDINVYPVSVLDLAADGAVNSATKPNPWVGIQVEMQAQTSAATPVKLLDTATVQMPSGYSIPFAYCSRPLLCISYTPGATRVTPIGSIADSALQQSAIGWLGSAESQRGAKFVAAYTSGGAAETRSVFLPADVPADTARSRFPSLDAITATAPLKAAALRDGFTINYATWAAANPDMRLISVRTLLTGGFVPLLVDNAPPLPPKTALALPGLSLPNPLTLSAEIWLGAQDMLGRRFYTRYALQAE